MVKMLQILRVLILMVCWLIGKLVCIPASKSALIFSVVLFLLFQQAFNFNRGHFSMKTFSRFVLSFEERKGNCVGIEFNIGL